MEEKTSVKVSEPVAANGTKPTKDFTAAGMLPKVNASTNSTGMLIKDVPPKKLNQAWPVILAVLLIVTLVALTAVFYPLIRSRKKIAMLSKKKQSRK
jgi:hypothetical protein